MIVCDFVEAWSSEKHNKCQKIKPAYITYCFNEKGMETAFFRQEPEVFGLVKGQFRKECQRRVWQKEVALLQGGHVHSRHHKHHIPPLGNWDRVSCALSYQKGKTYNRAA